MLIDLHLHSTFSDGLLTVEQLVKKAKQKKIKFLALTDHDTMAGVQEFQRACVKYKIKGLAGVEVSTNYQGLDLHLVAYHPQHHLRLLLQHLAIQQQKRRQRARVIIQKLKQLGLFFSQDTERHLLQRQNIGKPHLGRAVLQEKRNRLILKKLFNFHGSLSDFIAKFLDQPGQVAYVPKTKISALAAIRLINQTGAKAVLAHPDLDLNKPNFAWRTVQKLKQAGLFGLEMPNNAKHQGFYRRLARQLGLVITYGSDSHDGRGMGMAVTKQEHDNLINCLN